MTIQSILLLAAMLGTTTAANARRRVVKIYTKESSAKLRGDAVEVENYDPFIGVPRELKVASMSMGLAPAEMSMSMGFLVPAEMSMSMGFLVPAEISMSMALTPAEMSMSMALTPAEMPMSMALTPAEMSMSMALTPAEMSMSMALTPAEMSMSMALAPAEMSMSMGKSNLVSAGMSMSMFGTEDSGTKQCTSQTSQSCEADDGFGGTVNGYIMCNVPKGKSKCFAEVDAYEPKGSWTCGQGSCNKGEIVTATETQEKCTSQSSQSCEIDDGFGGTINGYIMCNGVSSNTRCFAEGEAIVKGRWTCGQGSCTDDGQDSEGGEDVEEVKNYIVVPSSSKNSGAKAFLYHGLHFLTLLFLVAL
jgi:hypothetical protein